MSAIGIKALKNDLSKHIRAAAAGATVLVTDRGKVVAQIVPPPVAEAGADAERQMAALIKLGIVTPARIAFTEPMPERNPVMSFEEMIRGLDESREDR